MQGKTTLLSTNEIAYALEIHPQTLDILVQTGLIPHTYIKASDNTTEQLRFNPYLILEWLQATPRIGILAEKNSLDNLRKQYKKFAPADLKTFDSQFAPKRMSKGYSLAKVPNKRLGFLYYVRYIENGKLVPSRWNTRTSNKEAAELFAEENRERLLREYQERKRFKNTDKNLYAILNNYYKISSALFEEAKQKGRKITERTQRVYNNWTNKVFIPFLRKNKIRDFTDITPPLISKLQTQMLTKGNDHKTVNFYIGGISAIFDHMITNGVINENVFKKVTRLIESRDKESRGCYEIETVKGVFDRKWHEELEYFLNLIIYTTDMRNSEIEKIQPQDIIKIKDCHFIDIPKSKSKNGVRIVPLHPFVYEKLTAYIRKYKIPDNGYLFSPSGKANQSFVYHNAKITLGEKLHKKIGIKPCDVEKYLDEQHITFYSGRYFWKTLMNANGLGDVEEYFMGHKVTSDVSKRYNRKDRVGRDMLVKKAKEVFRILDKWVFTG